MEERSAEPGLIINSPNNDKVKLVRALQRRRIRHKERQFIVEGVRVFEDAIGAGHVPAFVFLGPKWEEHERITSLAAQVLEMTSEVYPVGHGLMKSLSDTVTPQGILAVFSFVDLPALQQDFLLILDGVQDPGNIGTLLRSAEAAGGRPGDHGTRYRRCLQPQGRASRGGSALSTPGSGAEVARNRPSGQGQAGTSRGDGSAWHLLRCGLVPSGGVDCQQRRNRCQRRSPRAGLRANLHSDERAVPNH